MHVIPEIESCDGMIDQAERDQLQRSGIGDLIIQRLNNNIT